MTYFISGCEPSGDLLAADLVQALAARGIEGATGIAGPSMRAAGVAAMAHMEDFAVMGFVEVLKHLPRLKLLEIELLEKIRRARPRFAVLVDYPGFHLRLAEELRRMRIPVIQYVAPQLWAWGEHRTERLRRVTDLVLGIMPFEEEFFRGRGVNFQYVGTPQVDRAQRAIGDATHFGFAEGAVKIGFFPGSRVSEVSRIVPRVQDIRSSLFKDHPEAEVAVSVAPSLPLGPFRPLFATEAAYDQAEKALASHGMARDAGQRTVFVRGNSLGLMKTVDAALVTSGTATLECALSLTPMAVVYVTSPLTYWMARRVVKLPYISLVNLVAGRPLVHEYLQHFSPADAAARLWRLATQEEARNGLRSEFQTLFARVRGEPAKHAAQAIQSFLAEAKSSITLPLRHG